LDWQRIWQRIGNGLATDWQRIGSGLATDWQRIGNGLAADWQRIGNGLAADWQRIGNGWEEAMQRCSPFFVALTAFHLPRTHYCPMDSRYSIVSTVSEVGVND
jgi:hypothetical protein